MNNCKSCYWYEPKRGRQRYDRCRYFKGERKLILGTEAHNGCKHFMQDDDPVYAPLRTYIPEGD